MNQSIIYLVFICHVSLHPTEKQFKETGYTQSSWFFFLIFTSSLWFIFGLMDSDVMKAKAICSGTSTEETPPLVSNSISRLVWWHVGSDGVQCIGGWRCLNTHAHKHACASRCVSLAQTVCVCVCLWGPIFLADQKYDGLKETQSCMHTNRCKN